MRERLWTPERLSELKTRWEAGISVAELGRLYPEHSFRALETQAQKAGARRPASVRRTRQRMLRYLKRNVAVTTVDIATDLAMQTGEVRKVIKALHQEQLVHVDAYRGVSAMYAFGPGEDMTRGRWARLRKEKTNAQPGAGLVESHPDWPQIIFTRAGTGQRVPPRDPLIAAMFGEPVRGKSG